MQNLTEKQKKVLEVAGQLFATKGYKETSIRDIAEVLQLKPALVYAHIEKKEQLLSWICDDVAHRFVNIIDNVEKNNLSKEEKFLAYIKGYLDEQFVSIPRFEIYVKYHKLIDESQYYIYSKSSQKTIDYIESILNQFDLKPVHHLFRPNSNTFMVLEAIRKAYQWVNPNYNDTEFIAKVIIVRVLFGYIGNYKDAK